jgi:hypothetical protein
MLLYYRGEFIQILEGRKKSVMGILMNMLMDEAKSKPLSMGLSAFVSIYNQMRKTPYR